MAITSKLAVGQGSVDANNAFKVTGTSSFGGYVEITGTTPISSNPYGFFIQSPLQYWGGNNHQFSLRATTGNILANGFGIVSDRRIKKDFRLSQSLADLSTLKKLRVIDYRHIDVVEKGTDFRKGFIAQEVEEVLPEAVKIVADFIPNVYALSAQTKLSAGKMSITIDKNHEFAVGDEVKLVLQDSGEKRTSVEAVISENTFVVDWTGEADQEKVFVFGKKVSDFHTVDYDRIFTLNVSATQELARRVEQLEAENATLRQRNDGLQQQNNGLRGDVNDIYKRLQDLEKRSHLEK